MAVSEFLEDLVSHLPALQLLQQVGYQYFTPSEALELRGGKRSRVVLESILIEQLRKLIRRKKLVVAMGYVLRCHPSLAAMRAAVDRTRSKGLTEIGLVNAAKEILALEPGRG